MFPNGKNGKQKFYRFADKNLPPDVKIFVNLLNKKKIKTVTRLILSRND